MSSSAGVSGEFAVRSQCSSLFESFPGSNSHAAHIFTSVLGTIHMPLGRSTRKTALPASGWGASPRVGGSLPLVAWHQPSSHQDAVHDLVYPNSPLFFLEATVNETRRAPCGESVSQ